MASGGNEQTLKIHIAGQSDSSLNSAVSTAQKALSGLGSIAGTIAKTAAVAVGAATTAAVGFAKSAVDTGMEFDSSMSQVAATMGTTVDQIQDLRDFAMDMGAKTAFSATEAADALNYMALAGYDADTSMEMLPTVLNLAAAGSIDLAYASDMVTDAQSALGLSTEEAATMVDQMAKASSKSNTSVEQLGEAILTIGATASNMAGGTQELSTVLGALADNGIKGAEGGTHLRNILLALQNPTDEAAGYLKQLGVSVYDADGNMRNSIDIIKDMQSGMEGMSQEAKDAMISGIFNKTDLASVNALLNTTTERWDELGAAIGDSAGAAEQMADTQLDNLEGDVTLWKSALEGAQIVLSDQLTPTLREFVQFGTNGLTQVADAFKEGGLSGAMEAFGTVLSDAVNMIVDMLPTVVDAGMQLLGALGQGILDNLPTIIDAGVDIVLMIAEGIIQALPQLGAAAIQLVQKLGAAIIEHAPELLSMGADLLEQLVQGIQSGLPMIAQGAATLMSQFGEYLKSNLPTILEKGLEVIMGLTASIRENAGLLVDGAISLIQSLAQGLANSIPTLVQYVPTIVSNIAGIINDNAPKLLSAALNLIVTLGSGLIQAIPVIIQNIPQIIGAIVDVFTAFNWVSLGSSIISGLGNGISSMISFIKNLGSQVVEAVKGGFANLPTAMVDIGKNVIQGLWNGIKSMGSWLKEQVGNLISGLVSGVKGLLGISSPSKVFAQMGGYMAEGLGEGWNDEYASVKDGIESGLNFDAGTVGIDTAVNAAQSPAASGAAKQQTQTAAALSADQPQAQGGGVEQDPGLISSLWNQVQGMAANAVGTAKDWIGGALDIFTGGGTDNSQTYTDNSQQPIQITYSPQYTFSGASVSKDEIVEAEKDSQAEFDRMMKQWISEYGRTNLKGAFA